MSFNVGADAYDRFMGRYSVPLAPLFADFAGVAHGQRVVDVGCGPGALTAELVGRLGPAAVSAVDPSETFVAAAQQRHPGVACSAPRPRSFRSQMRSSTRRWRSSSSTSWPTPSRGWGRWRGVTRNRGVVAACVWDHEGGKGPLSLFWEAVRQLEPDVDDESGLAGAREGHLAQLFDDAGLSDDRGDHARGERRASRRFEEWWEPFTLGVGPAGSYTAGLDAARQTELRDMCRNLLHQRRSS